MKTEVYAELYISCKKINLDILDSLIELKSYNYHAIGDVSKSGILLDYSGWWYKTEIIGVYYSEEITDLLCNRIMEHFDKLEEFVKAYECQVTVSVVIFKIGDSLPSLTANRRLISILERLQGTLEFDGL